LVGCPRRKKKNENESAKERNQNNITQINNVFEEQKHCLNQKWN